MHDDEFLEPDLNIIKIIMKKIGKEFVGLVEEN